jgi:hypothetical protein
MIILTCIMLYNNTRIIGNFPINTATTRAWYVLSVPVGLYLFYTQVTGGTATAYSGLWLIGAVLPVLQ